MDYYPIQGVVEILLVTSCYRNRDKRRPAGPFGSNADFTSTSTACTAKTVVVCLFFRSNARTKRRFQMKVTWFSWEWMWHTFSFAERLFLPPRQKSTWNWPIHPWAGTGSLWFSFVLQCNPTCVRGNFGLKLQNSPKNCLAYMLDYIVRQKRKVNREKGYWSTSFPGSLEREDERAWERGWQLLCVVYLVGDWFGSGFTTLKWKPAKSNKFSLKNNRPQHEALGNKPHRLCSYSPEPRAEVYRLRLNFNISQLVITKWPNGSPCTLFCWPFLLYRLFLGNFVTPPPHGKISPSLGTFLAHIHKRASERRPTTKVNVQFLITVLRSYMFRYNIFAVLTLRSKPRGLGRI